MDWTHMLLKDAKRLPETHCNSLLLLCYSPVFSAYVWGGMDLLPEESLFLRLLDGREGFFPRARERGQCNVQIVF